MAFDTFTLDTSVLNTMTFDLLGVQMLSTLVLAALAYLPFLKQTSLRPVPVRHRRTHPNPR